MICRNQDFVRRAFDEIMNHLDGTDDETVDSVFEAVRDMAEDGWNISLIEAAIMATGCAPEGFVPDGVPGEKFKEGLKAFLELARSEAPDAQD